MKSFLGNFYRHFVIFFWSHYQRVIIVGFVMKGSIPELLIIFHFLGLLKQLFYISVQGSWSFRKPPRWWTPRWRTSRWWTPRWRTSRWWTPSWCTPSWCTPSWCTPSWWTPRTMNRSRQPILVYQESIPTSVQLKYLNIERAFSNVFTHFKINTKFFDSDWIFYYLIESFNTCPKYNGSY